MKAAADGSIETRVTDDADPERRRRTFEAIEERVSQLHGTIAMSVEQEGTTVTVVLPAYATRR
jgi:signal transduction histidine kinase